MIRALLTVALITLSAIVMTLSVSADNTVRTEKLDLLDCASTDKSDSSQGWSWSSDKKTLTLKDFTMKSSSGGIVMPFSDVKLVLKGTNSITVSGASGTDTVYGIMCLKNMTISGSGTLKINVSGATPNGITAKNLTVSGGTINITSQNIFSVSNASICGIATTESLVQSGGSIKITGKSKYQAKIYGISSSGDITLQKGSKYVCKISENGANNSTAVALLSQKGAVTLRGDFDADITVSDSIFAILAHGKISAKSSSNLNIALESTGALASGITSDSSDISVYGTVKMDLKAKKACGGIITRGKVTASKATITITAKSTVTDGSNELIGSQCISAVKGIYLKNSTVSIDCNAKSFLNTGIDSNGYIKIVGGKLNIKVTGTERSFGIALVASDVGNTAPTGLQFKQCSVTIRAEFSVISDIDANFSGVKIKTGGSFQKYSDTYTFVANNNPSSTVKIRRAS